MKPLNDKEKQKLLEILDRIIGETPICIWDCLTGKESELYARWTDDQEMYKWAKNREKNT